MRELTIQPIPKNRKVSNLKKKNYRGIALMNSLLCINIE